jgi:hypothetical protein
MASSIINSDDGLVSGTSGIKTTGGDDGVLNIQSNGSTVVAVDGSGVSVTGTLSSSGGYGAVSATTLTVNSNNISADNSLGFRNRIINGDMRIDQRNAGAAVTINTGSNTYTLDRWVAAGAATDGVFTVDQVTDAPTGFVNSTKITVTTADASIGADQSYLFFQFIEGNNVADLAWGNANAQTITLSFWVRSSLTGTFGGALNNSANNRGYPFTYSISAANTWEYKTITIAGDTSGTWLTDTGRGIALRFQIGAGSDRIATAGSWTGTSNIFGATGATNIISTLNADWYITGVQLEVGSVATPFERRPFGTELALCQRYYQTATINMYLWTMNSGQQQIAYVQGCVPMRASPTLVGTNAQNTAFPTTTSVSVKSFNADSGIFTAQDARVSNGSGASSFSTNLTCSSEL